MCRDDRRCEQARRLESLSAGELAPQTAGAPPVVWSDSDLAAVWAEHGRAVACAALARVERAGRVDSQVFTAMDAAADQAGARLHGAEFRLKDPASLARKIADKQGKAQLQGVSRRADEVADGITDVCRYTAVTAEHDRIPQTASAVVDRLRGQGWEVVEAESSYVAGNPYKGLHLLLREPGGMEVELQVHSEWSQQLKDESHLLYERSRAAETPLAQKRDLVARGVALWEGLPAPRGMEDLRELGGVRVRKKTYS